MTYDGWDLTVLRKLEELEGRIEILENPHEIRAIPAGCPEGYYWECTKCGRFSADRKLIDGKCPADRGQIESKN